MKATRKIACIALALVLVALAVAVPVSAAGKEPLVIVNGFASTALYANYGTEDQYEILGPDNLETAIGNIIGGFIKGCIAYGENHKDFEKFADKFDPIVNKYLAPLAYDLDGNPVDDTIGYDVYDMPMSEYSDEEKAAFGVFGAEYGKKYGEDKVYNFTYDWRKDPADLADELNAFISNVKSQSGAKKVNVIAISMGSVILQAFINEYGAKSLNNVVYASPAWQGTSIIGNLFTGHIQLDDFAIENYLVQMGNVSFVSHVASTAISWLGTREDLTGEYLDDVNTFVQGCLPRLYSDTIIPYIAGMPGIWSLIPAEYYEDAKAFLFSDAEPSDEYIAQLDAYHNIQLNAKNIVNKGMKDGMFWSIVCGYNRQIAPITESYEQSDGVVDVKYASGGATCSRYLKAFNDWDDIYYQKVNDGHNHLSWDYKVDASTCMFPEYVWFIKNMDHMGYNADNGTADYVIYLAGADKQCSVFDVVEPVTLDNGRIIPKYPQFSMYNTYEFAIFKSDAYFGTWVKRCPNDRPLGDIDNSTKVTTDDARLALQIASKQRVANADELVYGDTNEDGFIGIDDARTILCYAIGIDAK